MTVSDAVVISADLISSGVASGASRDTRGQTGDVRRRHRRSRRDAPRRRLPPGVFWVAGGCDTRRRDIRRQDVAVRDRAAAGERRRSAASEIDGIGEVLRPTSVAVAPAVPARGQQRIALRRVDVHCRHRVEVGVERVGGDVHQDHADAARVGDLARLLDARVGAAIAHDDLAGDLRGVERAQVAEVRVGGARSAASAGVDDRRADGLADPAPTPRRRAPRTRRTDSTVASKLGEVDAATVVYQGAPPCAVDAPGPSLPALTATNTPAAAALKNAMSSAATRRRPRRAERIADDVDAVGDRPVERSQHVAADADVIGGGQRVVTVVARLV